MNRSLRIVLAAVVVALPLSACSASEGTSEVSPNIEAIEDQSATPSDDVSEEPVPAVESLSTSQICKRLTSGGDDALLFRVPEHVVEIMNDPDVNDADLAETDYITEEIGEMIDNVPQYLTDNLTDMIAVHRSLSAASADGESQVSYSPGSTFLAAIDLGEICLDDTELEQFATDMIDLMDKAPLPNQ